MVLPLHLSVLLVLAIACFVVQLVYWLRYAGKLMQYSSPLGKGQETPISVIICARNEEQGLKQFLPIILKQRYTKFEVVVVDDGSTDGSWSYLRTMESKFKRLKVVRTSASKTLPGKRNAIKEGIAAAAHEHLLFTDADCYPATSTWIANMAKAFTPGIELVLGYSPYEIQSGILNGFIRYETFYTAVQYLGFAFLGEAYMGVGRNMAYTKSFFYRSTNFTEKSNPISGDDDLLVNELSTYENTAIVLNDRVAVMSIPKTTWASWLHQKRRHASAGHHYKLWHRLKLAVVNGSLVLFWFLLPFLFFSTAWIWAAILLTMFVLLTAGLSYTLSRIMNMLIPTWSYFFGPLAMSIFFLILGAASLIKVKTWQTSNHKYPTAQKKTKS